MLQEYRGASCAMADLDVGRRIPDHPRPSKIDAEFGSRRQEQPRLGLSASAIDRESIDHALRMVMAVAPAIELDSLMAQELDCAPVDRVQLAHR